MEVQASVDPYEYKDEILASLSVVNRSHEATIEAIARRFGIAVGIPESPPTIFLSPGDSLIVAETNLPRLTDRREYTQEEIDECEITFKKFLVQKAS